MSLGSKYAGHEMIVPRSRAVVNNVTVMYIYQKVCHESDRALKEETCLKTLSVNAVAVCIHLFDAKTVKLLGEYKVAETAYHIRPIHSKFDSMLTR
jgi:hypothetical protein